MHLRRAADRGRSKFDWLDSRHTFSFGHYHDPDHMGFGHLRVINDDRVVPGAGFGTHPHRDMEIISYVLEGAMAHKDSMGNGSVIRPGDVQRMSAGTGITHSEFNDSADDEVHFLQIWIIPDRAGHPPGYEQRHFAVDQRRGRLVLVASAAGRDGSVSLHQDADMYAGLFDGQESASHEVAPGRHAWLHVARGRIDVNGETLEEGDGAAFDEGARIELGDGEGAEVILFDLARPAHRR